MNKSDIVLSCENLEKRYGSQLILYDIDLELRQGELVSILGQSGTGKTTLFNILTGLDPDAGGSIVRGTRIGYMLQKDMLLPWKRLIDNVALPYVLAGQGKQAAREKAAGYFGIFGLKGLEFRYPARLSGGQRRRAAFLRTYLYSPALMLLDEPFTGLDAITRGQLYEWLLEHKEKLGFSILLITHDIEEAMALSDRIYVLSPGPPSTLWPPIQLASPGGRGERKDSLHQRSGGDSLHQEIRRRIFTAPSKASGRGGL
ncbi:MAG TPA: ATP-binding cassette domain-containing protein [Bacillota bacterium]|jgi:putative hydroxymethylpyrimidine transport system ATP-binding protein|nr:ATP-binding cassette domain-containing protein [Fastidiosipila sp.]HPX93683.1 ATP-binding cassette domain-containing protein [Bacillota bacterium]HQB81413.1 ATP-binding cassette domain-containing protein [Bacillota bacterium]